MFEKVHINSFSHALWQLQSCAAVATALGEKAKHLIVSNKHEQFHVTSSKYKMKKIFLKLPHYTASKLEFHSKSE